MKNIATLILLFSLTGISVASDDFWKLRQNFDDEDLCAETVARVGDHAHLFEVLARGNDQVFEELWDSPPFQAYLEDHPSDHDSAYDDPDAVRSYLDLRLPEFNQSTALDKKQDASLKEALKLRGAKPGRTGGYKFLAKLSAENKARLLQTFPYESGAEGMARAELLVAGLNLMFTHNAPRAVDRPRYSLLSSSSLETLGFSGGLNTSKFNRWLKSDEAVFFFVDPYFTREEKRVLVGPAQQARRRYGEFQCELDEAYANQKALLSVYVMDVDELIEFGRVVYPREYEALSELLFKSYDFRLSDKKVMPFEQLMEFAGQVHQGEAWDFVNATAGLTPLLENLRNNLHRYDFVPSDFAAVIRQTLLHRLNALRQSNARGFAQALQTLETGTPRELRELLNEQVFHPLRIPNDFEVKVPVAVPVHAIVGG